MAADKYIGIMSGTSLDGIDVVIARFTDGAECLAHESVAFPPGLRSLLYAAATAEQMNIDTYSRLHFLLAERYADAVQKTLAASKYSPSDIRAIGLHGQTVRHVPAKEVITSDTVPVGATIQLGSGSALAALTGIDVVSDFRSADVALGGQGAPLVPMFDVAFLRSNVTRIALNIGGIANLTVIPPTGSSAAVHAYDSGPGNMIIDELARIYFAKPYDEDGAIAAAAQANEALLEELLSHEYFATPPPKSTGRELFGSYFLSQFLTRIDAGLMSAPDAIRTATELTVRSIVREVGRYSNVYTNGFELIGSGGGVRNTFLMKRLAAELPAATVLSSDDAGIPAQAKEAIAFAFFAKAYLDEKVIHLPETTGASKAVLLGSLSRG